MGPNASAATGQPAIRVTTPVKERLSELVKAKKQKTGRRQVTFSEVIEDLLAKESA